MDTLIGVKKSQGQRFLENGMRIPVTLIDVKGNIVVSHKTADKDKYQAVQLGFSMKKNASRAEVGHAKRAKLDKAPKFLKEVRIYDDSPLPEVGSILNPEEVFAPGDIIDVSGFSKGKGFQGGVKRYGFHGGPKTHGQSDRHRAPGAIGSGTTPGRVYKGKRMAGNMGNENVTVTNLLVVDVTSDGVLVVKGLVPGIINGLIYVEKIGQHKKFVPLWKEPSDAEAVAGPGKVDEPVEEVSEEVKVEDVESTDQTEQVSADAATEPAPVVEEKAEEPKVEVAEATSAGLEPASDEPKEVVKDAK